MLSKVPAEVAFKPARKKYNTTKIKKNDFNIFF